MHGHAPPRRLLAAVLGLNALTFLAELCVGWWTNSLALLSDAGHMLGDLGALALSLVAATLALRPPSPAKTFGYARTEILAALVNGVVLLVIAALVLFEAAHRFAQPPDVRGGPVAIVAAFGLVVNVVSAWLLFSHSRDDLNMRGAFLHAASDALGSVGALTAGILVAWRGWTLADPVAGVFIGLLVASAGVRLLRDTIHVLMEGAPPGIPLDALRESMESTEGVQAVHDLHVWSVTSRFPALSAHVVADRGLSLAEVEQVLARLRGRLRERYGLRHVTLQVEPPAGGAGAVRPSGPADCLPCEPAETAGTKVS